MKFEDELYLTTFIRLEDTQKANLLFFSRLSKLLYARNTETKTLPLFTVLLVQVATSINLQIIERNINSFVKILDV